MWPVDIILSSAVLLGGLLALSVIDICSFRLPDWLTLPLIPAGLLAAWWLGDGILWHLAGAIIGYAGLVALELAYRSVRGRDGLGRGDAKLLAVGGAWCGAALLPVILLVASIAGLVWALALRLMAGREVGPDTALPFGPFLAAGIAAAWLLLRAGLWVQA
ncbi:prepilin peptidase [Glycocaulis abyssi]|uniref:Prepilin peptidase n=1 Tax=Glycocaulis abyssi TaxID=1433403 RepID=A0ABV9NC64_9PROT